jgi:hypothetical protein
VIGVGEQRGFREEFASASGMQDHQMVIDGAPNQAQPSAFDLVDRRRRVALPEQWLARSKDADSAAGSREVGKGSVPSLLLRSRRLKPGAIRA